MEKGKHGGSRPNSGRKKVKDKKVALMIYPRQSEIDAVGGLEKAKEIALNALKSATNMKTLIITAAITLVSMTCHAQNYDSLLRVIQDTQVIEQERVKLYLTKSHEQFSRGTLFMGIGLGVSAIGAMLQLNKEGAGPMSPVMMIAGGVTTSVGGVIMLDAHKWIGRAGRGTSYIQKR